MLRMEHVTKSFGKRMILEDISLQIEPGEFVCITGPSGAGKSSLLHILAGAEVPTSGSVEIDGVNIHAIPPAALQIFRRKVGIVFQDYKLLPHLTVAENIAFPLEVCGVPRDQIVARVMELLKYMQLESQATNLPARLSGGEKARTAIARAVAHKPKIILADEPTGNIDPAQSAAVYSLFSQIHSAGTSIILATHDTGLVDSLQQRVLRLDNGKITRDSKGGYAPKPAMQTMQPAPTSLPSSENSSDATKRKVRITSVNGN